MCRTGAAVHPRLLVTGAAGGVGRFAVALACDEKLRVIALAGAEDEEMLRSLGADVFVARSEDNAAAVRMAVPGGVDAVIDAAALHERIVPALRSHGRFATLRGWIADPDYAIDVVPVMVGDRATDNSAIVRLREQVELGLLPMEVAAIYPASEASEAHRAFKYGHIRGRISLTFA